MSHHAANAGHYVVLIGMANGARGGGGPADYPTWVRPFIIISVILTWVGLNVTSAVIGRNLVAWYVHVAVLMLVGSLFRVEFGNITLSKKEDDPK